MGSFSRLYDKLKALGVSHHDLTDVTIAIEMLKSAGDDLGEIMSMWHDDQGETKDEVVDKAREHIIKLQMCVDRIAISK